MNFITRILAVNAPPDTAMVWPPDFSFHGLTLGWFLVLLLLLFVGALAVMVFYVLERGSVGWFRRIILVGLRCGILFVLFILLLRPMLMFEFVGERPNGLAILIDNSESMKQKDRRLTEPDRARVALALNKIPLDTDFAKGLPPFAYDPKDPPRSLLVKNILKHPKLDLLEDLKKFGPLRTYYFGHDVHGLDDNKEIVEFLQKKYDPQASQTALADSIVKVLQSKDGDPPCAIVVVTDGQDNASKYTLQEAAEECKRAGVPLHIYGVGSSEGGQLQIKEAGGASNTLFAEDQVTIPIRWRAQGFKKGSVEITLTLGGVPVGKPKIIDNVLNGEDLRDEISFTVPKDPEKRETQDLVAVIKYHTGGANPEEDKLTRTMRIVESKIKILYIEHSPRWEFKFLQPALTNRFKKRCDVDFILINAAEDVAKKPPYLPRFFETREKFLEAKYNLIIIGDVASVPDDKPTKGLTRTQQEWIREFVQNRGGLIVMAGRQNMPSSYDDKSPIAELLPIEFKKEHFGLDEAKPTVEYLPTLTDAGLRTDWLSLADTPEENAEVWTKKLLGFHWNYPVVKLRPAATSLIVNPRAPKLPGEQPMPVLATHLYGKGRVIWLGTDETWRWRWNYQDKYFDRLWGQIIYQGGSPSLLGDGTERTQIALNRSQAVVGTQSTIHVTLLDKDFNPRKDPKVEAELVFVDAKNAEDRKPVPITLNLHAGNRGEYSALVPHQREGRFELRVKNPDVHTFSFRVDLPPKHELEPSGLAERALRDAAQLSGGRFYREEDLHRLTSNITERKTEFSRRQDVILWNWMAIVIFLGFITMEWLIRKFSDLS